MNPIKKLLKSYGDNGGRYNARRILRHFDDTMLFYILGARRIGKTDLFLRLACDLWQQYNLKTMWIRNKKVELEDPAFMADFLSDPKRFGWCPDSWTVRSDGVYTGPDKTDELIIKFQSISTFSNRRGGAHPGVVLMVLDEMMPEDRKYPRMCAQGLLSLSKTVFSGNKDARIFCLSNYVSAANPYFVRFRVYPDPDKDGTVFPDKGILIERCRGYRSAIEDDNPWNRVYKAGGVGNYESENEDSLITLISKIPKGCSMAPYLFKMDGIIYREWRKNGVKYFDELKGGIPANTVVYTPNVSECGQGVQLIHPFIIQALNQDMIFGTLRFKDPNVMFAILSMIYETV